MAEVYHYLPDLGPAPLAGIFTVYLQYTHKYDIYYAESKGGKWHDI